MLLTFFLTACREEAERCTITVTIEPLAWMVSELSAGTLPVQSMVPAGASPETYEPTPRQMVELAHSPLYIKVGQIGFETTWMSRLKANAPQLSVVDASAGVKYIESTMGVEDPHTWMSCTNARIMARNIHAALAAQYPEQRSVFDRGLDRLISKIDSVDREVRTALNGSSQHSFVIYHPALTYFAHDYHLLQLPMEEEGREPNAASIAQLIENAKTSHVQTIFVQRQFSPRNTVAIRTATGARAVEINPLDHDWPSQMLHVANQLR